MPAYNSGGKPQSRLERAQTRHAGVLEYLDIEPKTVNCFHCEVEMTVAYYKSRLGGVLCKECYDEWDGIGWDMPIHNADTENLH